MQKPTLSKPCPIALSRLKIGPKGFDCASCGKSVVDYRGKTTTALKTEYSKGTCGIFNEDQLAPIKMSLWNKYLFKTLTLVSLIGFNVQPISANTINTTSNSSEAMLFEEEEKKEKKDQKKEKEEAKKKRKKAWWNPFKKKKKKFTPVGCPSF